MAPAEAAKSSREIQSLDPAPAPAPTHPDMQEASKEVVRLVQHHHRQAMQRMESWLLREEKILQVMLQPTLSGFVFPHHGGQANQGQGLVERDLSRPMARSENSDLNLSHSHGQGRPTPQGFLSPDGIGVDFTESHIISSQDDRSSHVCSPRISATVGFASRGSDIYASAGGTQGGSPIFTEHAHLASSSEVQPLGEEGVVQPPESSKKKGRVDFDADLDDNIWFFSSPVESDPVVSPTPLFANVGHTSSWETKDRVQRFCEALVAQPAFEFFWTGVIVLNVVAMAFEVEYAAQKGPQSVPGILTAMNYVFTFAFIFELSLRYGALGWKHLLTGPFNYWIVFDTVMVLFAICDMILALYVSDRTMRTSILRVVRVTRTVRLFRFVKAVRLIRALRIMLYSVTSTLKSVFWAIVLLCSVIFCFAIFFTQVVVEACYDDSAPPAECADPEAISKYWGSMARSMLTLFESSTGGVDWDVPLRPVASLHWMCLVVYITFVTFTYFIIMNAVTAAVCQGAMEGQQYDREQTVRALLLNKQSDLHKTTDLFRNMFSKIDGDDSGEVSWQEFVEHINDESVQALLALLELTEEDLWVLFKLLDTDGSQKLNATEFVNGCLRLKGTARSIDLAKVAYENQAMARRLIPFMRFVKKEIVSLRRGMDQISATFSGALDTHSFH